MSGDEIEQFDDTCGIDSLVAAEARGDRTFRIAQINEGDRELIWLQLLICKAFECRLRSTIDEIL